MNYFIHDERDLSRAYVKSSKKFLKEIKKKLVKQVKRSRPSLAQEIKDMPMKDFRALWFVVQQGLKVKKKH